MAKTIDGTFPDWRRVVPKDVPHRIEFKAELLRAALERVTIMSAERGRAVRIYRGEDGMAHLLVKNPDSGTGMAKTFAKWPEAATVAKVTSIGFNADYLKDAIGKNPTNFTLRFSDAGSPALIEDGDEDLTRVLMPMRVD